MARGQSKGISLVETIVGVAILSLVFGALFASFQAALNFAERNRLRANALLLANEHVEVIRALPFDSIGTVSGLPAGTIPQLETITYQGKDYTRRTFIQYVDDDADGLGAADSLAADYKRVKVEISYDHRGVTQSFAVVSTVAPKSQESLVGAGVLRINVTDALNNPMPGATVRVVNNLVATSVDVTTFTNASGVVSFPGAWAGGGYELSVAKAGHSSAQTYTTSDVANPSPSPYNVAENGTTEVYFKIDLLSDLTLYTRAWPIRGGMDDSFADAGNLASMGGVQVIGGAMTLLGSPGSYGSFGTSTSNTVSSGNLGSWLLLHVEDVVPPNTTARYYLEYDTGGGTYALVPDADLPGNSAGLSAGSYSLRGLDPGIYGSLRIYTELTSSDPANSPQVEAYTLSYLEEDVPLDAIAFTLTSDKSIGTDALGATVAKHTYSDQTGGDGRWTQTDMEWDSYALTLPGYTVAEACPSLPVVLEPDTALLQTITLASVSTHALTISVVDHTDAVIEGAEVAVVGGATDTTRATGPCGIAYFGGLTTTTYTVTVRAPGLTGTTTTVAVDGPTTRSIQLAP